MSIRQEAFIDAEPQAVYDALTDGEKFATATGMPARLSPREGDDFAIFGGRIEGRQIELVPGRRIVQAWRFGAEHPSPWDAGVYSIVRFTLTGEQEGGGQRGTRLVIDHIGVPPQWQDHISGGYPTFYQEPLQRYFGGWTARAVEPPFTGWAALG